MKSKVRTRFAPSPTGYMHIGNLRTAIYEYLVAKSQGGDFILRIEDTDRNRLVEDAEKVIYDTLETVGLKVDEGPNSGGEYGPYRQSERKGRYLEYAKELVNKGRAYYCFCERSEDDNSETTPLSGHKDICRDIPLNEVNKLLANGKKHVIRQKMPLEGKTSFEDLVFGEVEVNNKELEDQILIKSDGYPTYNFANVIDDYEMNITHVVRGSEYLSSTPKYNLLYEAFGWDIPKYIHLPLIMGKNEDGSTSKLSKRHGAVSFEDLIRKGYLPEAIINYIVFLGWSPDSNRELFTLEELEKEFSISRISKSPSIFDYKKLDWFNEEYLRRKSEPEFLKLAYSYIAGTLNEDKIDICKIAQLLQKRISRLDQIPDMIDFFESIPQYDVNLFQNEKSKSTFESSIKILSEILNKLSKLSLWTYNELHDLLIKVANENGMKNSCVMWPVRIAISGKMVTPGGAIEILEILGKEKSLRRIEDAIKKLENLNI